MIKLTDTHEITPYLWVYPAEERVFYLVESERKQASQSKAGLDQ
jgi:hypothetical protein